MKTLNHHQLLYDSDCPMCAFYADRMVKHHLISADGKTPYGSCTSPLVDMNRARNEIALIDYDSNTVIYGLDSWLFILTTAFPRLRSLLYSRQVQFLGKRLYNFISYNRKVIAAGKNPETAGSCVPDFNLKYRLVYILFAWLVVSLVVSGYSRFFITYIGSGFWGRECLINGGQLLFQWPIVYAINKKQLVHYWGNQMTVALIGALLLLPGLIIGQFIPLPTSILLIHFGSVIFYMLLLHLKRTKILGLGLTPTFSWCVYRVLILILLLNLK